MNNIFYRFKNAWHSFFRNDDCCMRREELDKTYMLLEREIKLLENNVTKLKTENAILERELALRD